MKLHFARIAPMRIQLPVPVSLKRTAVPPTEALAYMLQIVPEVFLRLCCPLLTIFTKAEALLLVQPSCISKKHETVYVVMVTQHYLTPYNMSQQDVLIYVNLFQ